MSNIFLKKAKSNLRYTNISKKISYLDTKQFSSTRNLLTLDPRDEDPFSLGNTRKIARSCESGKDVEEYFREKENYINETHRRDSNNGAIEGIPASELDRWLSDKNELIAALAHQKNDVYALTDFVTDASVDSDNSGYDFDTSSEEGGNESDQEMGNTQGTSESNDTPSITFPQDSSGVMPDYSEPAPFDDDF